jgi:hypothetical protein
MAARYLSDAIDDILKALESSKDSKQLAVTRALAAACDALSLLDEDLARQSSSISSSMTHLEALRQKYLKELVSDLNNLLLLLNDFEQGLLAAAGVPPRVREFIRRESEKLIIDPLVPVISAPALRDALAPFKAEVCAESKRLGSLADTEDLARKSALVLGGALLISINASVDAATTAGTFPWLTTLSGPAGGGLITKSGIFKSKK